MSATCSKYLLLCHRKFLARSNTNLPFNKVDTCDDFGDWVFHLQASVHLKEEELAILEDELNSSGVVVTNGLCCLYSSFTHCFFDTVWQTRCWCFFNQFLVTTLSRAVTSRDPHNVAVLVAYKLYFNVTWPREVTLNINFIATKETLCFALC